MRRFYPGQELLKYFKEKAEGKPEIWDQTYEELLVHNILEKEIS